MKTKILNYLKNNWWKILIYILTITFGLLLIPVFVDIKEIKIFLEKFGIIGCLMDLGYLVFWIWMASGFIELILFFGKKNNNKERKQN